MARNLPQMDIRTTIVPGDYDSFKAALTRSMVGVTFKKFKRVGVRFYALKTDNMTTVDIVCKALYEEVQKALPEIPLKHLRLATGMRLVWDTDGRILDVTALRISVYMPVGELSVASANIQRKSEKIRADLYYSPVDFASKSLRKEVDQLVDEIGSDFIERHDHDYLDPVERKAGEKRGVKLVPSVVINDERPIENPTKSRLAGEINKHLSPIVNLMDSKFTRELTLGPILQQLSVSE